MCFPLIVPPSLLEMRRSLAEGFPFVFGFTVHDRFKSPEVEKTGVLDLPPRPGTLDGHAVMAGGYDDAAKRFTVRNSWGTDWGQGGYFTMPLAYLEACNPLDSAGDESLSCGHAFGRAVSSGLATGGGRRADDGG